MLLVGIIVLLSINLSSNFVRRACCGDWWNQFQDAWDQAQDWFNEKKDKADDWWDQANEWAQDKADEAQQWWDENKRKAEDWWNEKSEQAQEWWEKSKEEAREYWEKAQEWGEETRQKVEQFARSFEQEARENFEWAVEKAKNLTGPYKEEAFNILEQEARRQLCEEYSDPVKVEELERKRDLMTEATITAVKLIPIYDPESGEVHTFDQFAGDLYEQIPGIEGSDLAEDPVRCVALMVLDSDYLLYAKIIRAPNGKWMSITEALSVGYRVNGVMSAVSDYNLAREGFRTNDSAKIENGMMSFASRIKAINEGSQQSLMSFDPILLLPFGLIGIAAGVFLKWDSRRKRAILKA